MKFGKMQFLLLVGLLVTSSVSELPNICRYQGRQMTFGQKITNCYVTISCENNGIVKILDACPKYSCVRPSQMIGYKVFDATKPYPRCCGGPICGGRKITHKMSRGTYVITAK